MNTDLNPELNPEFDEVLLTAYLDDEVTAVERARVEEQLRTSESSRKLLDELRSVRTLVSQLHLSQPSRSFRNGPWSETTETVASPPKVVFHDRRTGWNVSYQRLASLAALLAIAACVSVLLYGPERGSMTLSENATNKVESATHSEEVAQDIPIDSIAGMPAAPRVASTEASPLANTLAMETQPSGDTRNEPLGRLLAPSGPATPSRASVPSEPAMTSRTATASGGPAGGAGRALSEIESSLSSPGGFNPDGFGAASGGVPGAAGGSRPRATGVGGVPSGGGDAGAGGLGGRGGLSETASDKSMPKQKADNTDPKRVAAATMLAESASPDIEIRNSPAPVPEEKSASSEANFFFSMVQRQAEGDWIAITDPMEIATIDVKEDRDLPRKQEDVNLNTSPSSARFTYRFRGTVSDQDKASFAGADSEAKQPASIAPVELHLGSSEKKVEQVSDPVVVELQVPADKWEQGATRLRQMGLEVPLEIPQTGYVDFIAMQTSKDAEALENTNRDPASPLETELKKSSLAPATGWVFRRVELNRNPSDSTPASPAKASLKDEQEGIQPEGRTRIRVRVLKKE